MVNGKTGRLSYPYRTARHAYIVQRAGRQAHRAIEPSQAVGRHTDIGLVGSARPAPPVKSVCNCISVQLKILYSHKQDS